MRIEPYPWTLEEARAELNRIRHPFSIALDRAKNPFNIGAIIRTAHSFLAEEVVLVGSEPWYERAAMGMHRYENIIELPDDEAFVSWARRRGRRVVAFEREGASASLWQTPLLPGDCLLLGNENEGIRPALRQTADVTVTIPMFGINHSFPLGMCAGIAMHEWCRQHYAGGRTA